MAKNYGYTFSYDSNLTPSGRARVAHVYRTKEGAKKYAKSFRDLFKGRRRNVRVVKATKSEYNEFISRFQTGK